jgi:predicted TIM-barrel fold metal-dependent hydrolase
MRDGFRVIDADGHTIDPPDVWDRYLEAEYRHRVGTVRIPTSIFAYHTVDGRAPLPIPDPAVPFDERSALRWSPEHVRERFGAAAARGFDALAVVEAMDGEGVDVAVIYGPGYDMWGDGIDPELQAAMARAYTRWLADYREASGGRIIGASPVPIADPARAAEHVRWAADTLGTRWFWTRPNPIGGRVLGDAAYDAMYDTLEGLGACLGIHHFSGVDLPAAGRDRFRTFVELHTCDHQMEQQMAMLSMIVQGVFERFPRLRVGYLEAGCAWLPSWLHRIEEHLEIAGWKEAPQLTRPPLEYFRRNCFITCEADEALLYQVVEVVGDDNLLFATDYPHPDAKYPGAVDTFLTLARVSDESKRKILWDNPLRFYGFDEASLPSPATTASA